MNRKLLIFGILATGILISGVVLFFSQSDIFAQPAPTQWTERTGEGISIPACNSSSPTVTCSGSTPTAYIDWTSSPHYAAIKNSGVPGAANIYINGQPWAYCVGYNNKYPFTFPGGYTISSGLANNTTYSYSINFYYDTPLLGCNPTTGSGEGLLLLGNESGSFTTPNCAPPPPPTVDLRVNGQKSTITIPYNTSVTISWTSTGASSCSVPYGPWSGTSGSYPSANWIGSGNVTINCTGPGGSASDIVYVYVTPPPPGNFSLSTGGSVACNSVPLSWTASSGATGYRILRDLPRVDISPYQPYTALNFTDTTVSQNATYPYQIEAYNSSGTNRSNTINITTPYCPPTLSFSCNPTNVYQGQSSTCAWSSTYTNSCIASGAWSGSEGLSGSQVVVPNPPPSATYSLSCSGPGGSTGLQSSTVTIAPLALPNWQEIIPR